MTTVDDRVREEWREETTARERIKEVLTETTEFEAATEIAERALVSEPTARKYLNEFVDEGVGVAEQDGRVRKYKRHDHRRVQRRIEQLRTERTRQELLDGIWEMNERIRKFRDTYGVDGPADLAVDLEPGEDGWADVGRWQATERNLALAKAALRVEEAHRLVEA